MSNARRPLFATETGSRLEAFGSLEWALLSSVALIWGSSFLLIEVALEGLRPGLISWGRIALGFATLALFPTARRPIERAAWPRIAVLGTTWVAVPFVLFPIAQQHIDSSLAGMLNALIPIFAGIFAAIFLRALPRRVQMIGILIGFLGAIAISLPALGESESSVFGVILIAVASVFYGLSINLAIPLQHRYGGPAVMFRALGIATLMTAPFGALGLSGSTWDRTSIAAVVVLGILGSGLAFVLMTQFIGRVGPVRGGVAIYFIPIVSIILGVVVLSESVTGIQIGGTGLVLLGAYATSRKER